MKGSLVNSLLLDEKAGRPGLFMKKQMRLGLSYC